MKSKIKQWIYFTGCTTMTLLIAWPGNKAIAQVDRQINKKAENIAKVGQPGSFAKNTCGTYSSGEFVRAESQLNTANGCATIVNSATDIVYFTARDRIILYPGFKATVGGRFVAQLEPCTETMSGSGENIIRSGHGKCIFSPVITAKKTPAEDLVADQTVAVNPNPFTSSFELVIRAKQDTRVQIAVYNSAGIKVLEKSGVGLLQAVNRIKLDGSNFARGVYIVEVNVGSEKTIKKIVKI